MGLKPIVILDEGFEDNFIQPDPEIQCISGYGRPDSALPTSMKKSSSSTQAVGLRWMWSTSSSVGPLCRLNPIEDTEVFEDQAPQFYRDPSDFKQLVFLKPAVKMSVIFSSPPESSTLDTTGWESATSQIKLKM